VRASDEKEPTITRDRVFGAILHDIHFWIPLIVLLVGLLLLHFLH
jgi:hypothetical protein